MTWTPDVPSSALQANEYSSGLNVETDVRGIRSVFGDEEILTAIPDRAIYVTGGYRANGQWWLVIGNDQGRWFIQDNDGTLINVTPGYSLDPNAQLPGYYDGIPITEAWNGDVLFINDSVNAPMFLRPAAVEFEQYSQVAPLALATGSGDGTIADLYFEDFPQPVVPFAVGSMVRVTGTSTGANNTTYDGDWEVLFCDTDMVTIACTGGPGVFNQTGFVQPLYLWNYDLYPADYEIVALQNRPRYQSITAGFQRLFSTPNVGSILIAGDFTALNYDSSTSRFPNTVRWSQAFGLNDGPLTWQPTLENVANELEVPVRGPVVDGFPCAGNFYVCSYWDTVVFSPINYQSTTLPILGVRLMNQGRGLLNQNCWAAADNLVYGLDARDIWVFNGQEFKGLGNQRVKNWFFENLNGQRTDLVWLENNTQKNQIEIYFPSIANTGDWCDYMISYRYDLDVWQPPRQVPQVSMSCDSPIYRQMPDSGLDFDKGSRTVIMSRGVADVPLVQKDRTYEFVDGPITSEFERTNIALVKDYSLQLLLHRVLPEMQNLDLDGRVSAVSTGNANVSIGGSQSSGQATTYQAPIAFTFDTQDPWVQADQNAYRQVAIKYGQTSNTTAWISTSVSWQYAVTQDAR